MMLERYPNLKEEVGNSILVVKSPLYLKENLLGGQLPPMLWRYPVGRLSQRKRKKEKMKVGMTIFVNIFIRDVIRKVTISDINWHMTLYGNTIF